MSAVESAWSRRPDYRIDLVPIAGTARVLVGPVVVAESDRAIRLIEQDHVERLYLPRSDVRADLVSASETHTVCPFKGRADYLSAAGVEDLFWTYPDPFPEMKAIAGLVGVYHEKCRVEIASGGSVFLFPVWGDQSDLIRLLDVTPAGEGKFTGAGYHQRDRDVVEGGQLLGAAIVAASKASPGQRVTAASATFARVATFDPLDLSVEFLRQGRTFSSMSVNLSQEGRLCAPVLVLTGSDVPDLINHSLPPPPVAGPDDSPPFDMGVVGRDLRIVDGAYPDRSGPPELHCWFRFRDNPPGEPLRQALLAHAITQWPIAAAMRPHPGLSQSDAHVTLTTGPVAAGVTFCDDAPLDDWILYETHGSWAGRGLCVGEGRIWAGAAPGSGPPRLLAVYTVQAMIRPMQAPAGADPSRLM